MSAVAGSGVLLAAEGYLIMPIHPRVRFNKNAGWGGSPAGNAGVLRLLIGARIPKGHLCGRLYPRGVSEDGTDQKRLIRPSTRGVPRPC